VTDADAATRQILSTVSDGQPHQWCAVQRLVARTHGIELKDVTSILRHMVRTGQIERIHDGIHEPTVRLPGGVE
jgi:hypothetical protein